MSNDAMNRRQFLRAALATGAALSSRRVVAAREQERPNIVLISTDQQHGWAYGAADPFFYTPHIDSLARSGAVFTHAFCTTPQCSASRSSLYTGLYPHKTGVLGNVDAFDHRGNRIPALPEGMETLGSRLRGAGYRTAYFGKWHVGNRKHFAAHFDESELDGNAHIGLTARGQAFLQDCAANPKQPFALFLNYVNPHDIYEVRKHLTDERRPADVAVPLPKSLHDDLSKKPLPQSRFMHEDQGEIFENASRDVWERYRLFYREKCRLVDAEIGQILRKLAETGLDRNTIVVFCADHGDMDTYHGLVFKGPFMYENLVRVPLIVRVPEAFGGARGVRTDTLVSLLDVLPTLCDFAGAEYGGVDGVSLRGFLTRTSPPPAREFVVGEYFGKQRWINPIRMLRTRRFKYTRYLHYGEELYDLETDPDEMVNLANDPAHGDTKRALADALDRWMRENGDTEFNTYWPTDRDGSPIERL